MGPLVRLRTGLWQGCEVKLGKDGMKDGMQDVHSCICCMILHGVLTRDPVET